MKTIIYLVGESAQGKTTLALKLSDILGGCIIYSDEASRLTKPHGKREDKIGIYQAQDRDVKVKILDGYGYGALEEREIVSEALNIEPEHRQYMLKLEIPGLKKRQDIKWAGKLERVWIDKIDNDFKDNFRAIDKTYIIDNFDYCEEMFKEHKLKAFNYFKKYDIPNNK